MLTHDAGTTFGLGACYFCLIPAPSRLAPAPRVRRLRARGAEIRSIFFQEAAAAIAPRPRRDYLSPYV